MPYRWLLGTIALAAGAGLWWGLGVLIPSGTERFYLMVPPVAAALAILASKNPREWLATQGRLLAGYFAFVFVLSLAGAYLYYGRYPGGSSWNSAASYARETFLAGYCLLAIVSLLLPIFGLLQWGVGRLDEWWRGSSPDKLPPSADRLRVRRYVCILLLAPVVLPYLLGVSFIHRMKTPNADPVLAMGGRAYEEVTLRTSDGYRLRGWFLPAEQGPATRTLLVCHGIAANRSDVLAFVQLGDALSANTLLFDFRGHGESQGHTISLGHHEKLDVLAAIEYLRQERPDQCLEIFGLGLSMGSGALVMAAAEAEPPLDGLVLDSGFASAIELTDKVLTAYPRSMRPLLTSVGVPLAALHAGCRLDQVRPIDHIAQVRAPTLFIHCENDELISADHARRLFAAADPISKELWIAKQGGHCSAFAYQTQEYLWRVKDFHIARPITHDEQVMVK